MDNYINVFIFYMFWVGVISFGMIVVESYYRIFYVYIVIDRLSYWIGIVECYVWVYFNGMSSYLSRIFFLKVIFFFGISRYIYDCFIILF